MRSLHTTQREKDECTVICNKALAIPGDGEKSSPLNQTYCPISFFIFYDLGQSNCGGEMFRHPIASQQTYENDINYCFTKFINVIEFNLGKNIARSYRKVVDL